MTLDQLGQAVKAKYPVYASKSDTEVGTAAFKKYPDAYKHLLEDRTTDQVPQIKTLGQQIGQIGQGAQDVAVGIAKSGVRAATGIASMTEKGLTKTSQATLGHDINAVGSQTLTDKVVPQSAIVSKNKAERVGQGIGDTAQIVGPLLAGGLESANKFFSKANDVGEIARFVKPVLTKGEEETAKIAGQVERGGKLATTQLKTTGEDLEEAEKFLKGIIDPNKSALENINSARASLKTTADTVINEAKGGTWATSNLKGELNTVKIPLAIKDTAEMTQVNNINDFVEKLADGAKKDASGAVQLARTFRQSINDEFGENIWGKDTPIAKYIRSVNQQLNDFAAAKMPDGKLADGTLYKDAMKKMTVLNKTIENLATKAEGLGSNMITRNPLIKGGLKMLEKKIPF